MDQNIDNQNQPMEADEIIEETKETGTISPSSQATPDTESAVQSESAPEDIGTTQSPPDLEADQEGIDQLYEQEVPNLTISREQTPDTDHYEEDSASGYSESTPQPEVRKRGGTSILDTDRAVKKVRTDAATLEESPALSQTPDPEYDPENPAGVRQEKIRRRVAAKVIDKFWTPLDSGSLRSFDNICQVSLNKVQERYHGMSSQQTKVEETQRVVTNSWLNSRNLRSFAARLSVSKLPPLKSLDVRMKGIKSGGQDSLNVDLVLRQKKACEAYLLAELEQLSRLEAYYKTLSTLHELDTKYLHDFKKTTSSLRAEHTEEKAAKMAELHLDSSGSSHDDIHLLRRAGSGTSMARFDPNKDGDIKGLLEGLNAKLSAQNAPVQDLLKLCDQLDTIQTELNSARFLKKS